ncbi:GNAT family N-acetyltransferase [Thalassospira sp. SM2505]
MMKTTIEIRPVAQADRKIWAALFSDYMAFYGCTPSDAVLETTWRWILDPAGPMECLIAVKGGQVVGFAQYRAVPETLTGAWFGQLDDLFVAPTARRQGVADALMTRLDDIAHERGWFKLVWITAQDNATARKLYDRIGKASNWVVYERPQGD